MLAGEQQLPELSSLVIIQLYSIPNQYEWIIINLKRSEVILGYRNVRRNKEKEETDALNKKFQLDTDGLTRTHIEKKNKFANLTRCLNNKQREEDELSRTTHTKEHIALQKAQVEQEQQLVTEIDEIRKSEVNEKKQRQLLRQNCEELRDLERKLRAAYVAKHQIAQMAEKEAIRLHEKVREKECNTILQSAWIKDDQNRTMMIQEDIRRKAEYRQELQDQMIAQEKNRRFEYEEFLREKKILDDIVQRIHDENERTIEERMCRMRRTQQEIEAFKAAQEIWKKKQKEELVEENRKIQEYLLSKTAASKERKELEEKIAAAKTKICDDIGRQIYDIQRQRQEREDIICQLIEEEKKEELENKHRTEIENEFRRRVNARISLTHQMEEHEEQKRQQAEEEGKYREQLIAEIAKNERLEQLSNEKKRRKMLEVRREVERMMTERRQLQAEKMQLEMKILADDKREQEERQRLIQEERIRMLKDHAHNLIGYLPKGILREDDLPHLGSTVVDKYGRR
ncbi:hypothetical protein RI129_001219 [Pyrocoelia pectoralis]|uniref:Meiosis-specific nuclear structural protein 1 n=1 Tax=Pyrocoelia pectoralis TaxID=417401 RepID=A0AAN7VME5_9COLE